MEGYNNLATGASVDAKYEILKDLNLAASTTESPIAFTLDTSVASYGIYKIILYAPSSTDSIAGWQVIIPCIIIYCNYIFKVNTIMNKVQWYYW